MSPMINMTPMIIMTAMTPMIIMTAMTPSYGIREEIFTLLGEEGKKNKKFLRDSLLLYGIKKKNLFFI
jgi:hypothetical protein